MKRYGLGLLQIVGISLPESLSIIRSKSPETPAVTVTLMRASLGAVNTSLVGI